MVRATRHVGTEQLPAMPIDEILSANVGGRPQGLHDHLGPPVLHVRSDAVAAMLDHGRRGAPNEVAGLLGADESQVIVSAVELGDGSPDAVSVAGADIAAATAVLTERGLHPAGSYHSHPSRPPAPTETDRLAMRFDEPMLILTPAEGEVRAFRLAADRVHVEQIGLREIRPDDAPA